MPPRLAAPIRHVVALAKVGSVAKTRAESSGPTSVRESRANKVEIQGWSAHLTRLDKSGHGKVTALLLIFYL